MAVGCVIVRAEQHKALSETLQLLFPVVQHQGNYYVGMVPESNGDLADWRDIAAWACTGITNRYAQPSCRVMSLHRKSDETMDELLLRAERTHASLQRKAKVYI